MPSTPLQSKVADGGDMFMPVTQYVMNPKSITQGQLSSASRPPAQKINTGFSCSLSLYLAQDFTCLFVRDPQKTRQNVCRPRDLWRLQSLNAGSGKGTWGAKVHITQMLRVPPWGLLVAQNFCVFDLCSPSWELRSIYHHHHHPESKKRHSSEANSGSMHSYGRYGHAVKTRKTISTIAILWLVKAVFEKRAATVGVDTLTCPDIDLHSAKHTECEPRKCSRNCTWECT